VGVGAINNTVIRVDANELSVVRVHDSTHAVFLGLLIAGAVTASVLLSLVPRHFPTYSPANDNS